jgi:predicted ArsR family transcriptional regulator
MTNHEKILRDLSITQSTADSIAGRLGLPTEAVQLLLSQLVAKRLVESGPLAKHPSLLVYRLTSGTTLLKP